MTQDNYGTIVFLNGTSSSGKTTIMKELETVLQERYSYTSIDPKFDSLLTISS